MDGGDRDGGGVPPLGGDEPHQGRSDGLPGVTAYRRRMRIYDSPTVSPPHPVGGGVSAPLP